MTQPHNMHNQNILLAMKRLRFADIIFIRLWFGESIFLIKFGGLIIIFMMFFDALSDDDDNMCC